MKSLVSHHRIECTVKPVLNTLNILPSIRMYPFLRADGCKPSNLSSRNPLCSRKKTLFLIRTLNLCVLPLYKAGHLFRIPHSRCTIFTSSQVSDFYLVCSVPHQRDLRGREVPVWYEKSLAVLNGEVFVSLLIHGVLYVIWALL